MKTPFFPVRPLLLLAFLAAGLTGRAAPVPEGSGTIRLDTLLWREVQDSQGRTLGSVSDVLVQMPSGRVVFVAIVPAEFFSRPKGVPPGALEIPARPDAPVRLDVTPERWRAAPLLDWDTSLLVKQTGEGARIYGYYQQAWREPDPAPPWFMRIVGREGQEGERAKRYVPLKKLLLDRVTTAADQQIGFVRDFLLDWADRRVTHALVSPQFTPLAKPDDRWFAVPVALLGPPLEQDALTVNSAPEAFREAKPLPEGRLSHAAPAEIYRYPAVPAWSRR